MIITISLEEYYQSAVHSNQAGPLTPATQRYDYPPDPENYKIQWYWWHWQYQQWSEWYMATDWAYYFAGRWWPMSPGFYPLSLIKKAYQLDYIRDETCDPAAITFDIPHDIIWLDGSLWVWEPLDVPLPLDWELVFVGEEVRCDETVIVCPAGQPPAQFEPIANPHCPFREFEGNIWWKEYSPVWEENFYHAQPVQVYWKGSGYGIWPYQLRRLRPYSPPPWELIALLLLGYSTGASIQGRRPYHG